MLRRWVSDLGVRNIVVSDLLETEDDGLGVIAEIARKDGRRYSVRADWLIAADGAGSGVRQGADIELISAADCAFSLAAILCVERHMSNDQGVRSRGPPQADGSRLPATTRSCQLGT
jgi:2-polyprenyl-6-methoxyphenol hydroxylase-like FAD-dependent oxidoreductase